MLMKRILPLLMILISCSVYSQDAKEEIDCGEYGRLYRDYDFPQLLNKLDSLKWAFETQCIKIETEALDYYQERLHYHTSKGMRSSFDIEHAMTCAKSDKREYLSRRMDSLRKATGVFGINRYDDTLSPYNKDCE